MTLPGYVNSQAKLGHGSGGTTALPNRSLSTWMRGHQSMMHLLIPYRDDFQHDRRNDAGRHSKVTCMGPNKRVTGRPLLADLFRKKSLTIQATRRIIPVY